MHVILSHSANFEVYSISNHLILSKIASNGGLIIDLHISNLHSWYYYQARLRQIHIHPFELWMRPQGLMQYSWMVPSLGLCFWTILSNHTPHVCVTNDWKWNSTFSKLNFKVYPLSYLMVNLHTMVKVKTHIVLFLPCIRGKLASVRLLVLLSKSTKYSCDTIATQAPIIVRSWYEMATHSSQLHRQDENTHSNPSTFDLPSPSCFFPFRQPLLLQPNYLISVAYSSAWTSEVSSHELSSLRISLTSTSYQLQQIQIVN